MRVLVTRSPADAERTALKLVARGHEPLLAPVTEILPTGEPAPAQPYDGLIVTSAHAVQALAAPGERQVPLFAVGARTAQALKSAGFPQPWVGEGDAAALSRLIRRVLPPGCTLLHATGRQRKEEPAVSLRRFGFTVLSWEAYEARALESLPLRAIEALRTGQVDAALHYSRRSADLFIRMAKEAGLASTLGAFPHLALSTDVAAPLAASGVPVLVARDGSEDALLALLDRLP